jgi:hypothetical protein
LTTACPPNLKQNIAEIKPSPWNPCTD